MIPRAVCSAGEKLVLTGYAIDIGHSISGIEFSLDDGAHWTRYDMIEIGRASCRERV